MKKSYIITSVGLLGTSMTNAGCSDKTETDIENVTHDSIADNWTATSMSYDGESLTLPYESCEANEEGMYCYTTTLEMMIDEAQRATINLSYMATLDDYALDESEVRSYDATVELQNVSNSYRIVFDNEDDFWGSLDCTLSSETLTCMEDDQQITFSR